MHFLQYVFVVIYSYTESEAESSYGWSQTNVTRRNTCELPQIIEQRSTVQVRPLLRFVYDERRRMGRGMTFLSKQH